MLVLAGKPPVGKQIVRPDHHHVDALDGDDLVRLGQGCLALELHHERGRGIERGIGLGDRKRAVVADAAASSP